MVTYFVEPEKVESRIIGGKLKTGGFLSTADSNNLGASVDHNADPKLENDDFISSFKNKVTKNNHF